MAKAVIGSRGRWTEKVTFAEDVGGWETLYPVSNLKVLPLAKVARSTGLTLEETKFAGTFDRRRPVRLIGLCRHNLSLDARVRIRLYSDSERTDEIYDSGWVDVWPRVYAPDELEYEDYNWYDGNYTTDEIAGYSWTRPFWLSQIYSAEGFLVEIDDQENAEGKVQMGLFEVALGWQTSVNFAYGSQYGYRHRTKVVEADGGVKYTKRETKPRVFQGEINFLPQDEAKSNAFEHFRQMDVDTPFLWVPDPDDTRNFLRDVFLARNVDPGLITYSAPRRNSVPIKFEEVI